MLKAGVVAVVMVGAIVLYVSFLVKSRRTSVRRLHAERTRGQYGNKDIKTTSRRR